MFDNTYMKLALVEANKAFSKGEVPIGAVIYSRDKKKILAKAHNLVETNKNALCHAELLAIFEATKITASKYLTDCDIFVSLEPCSMCASAIAFAKISRLFYGAADPKSGGVAHGAAIFQNKNTHHYIEIFPGIMEEESRTLLQKFFSNIRK